jgi:TRAP-type C4-dicarboxylate transport system permease small subunit
LRLLTAIFSGIEKGLHGTKNAFMAFGMSLLFLLMLIGTIDVILRYLFNAPIEGTVEIGKIILMCMVVLGWAHTQAAKSHVTVDFLVSKFSPRAQNTIDIVTCFISLFLFVLIVWQATVVGRIALEDKRVIQVIHLPVGIMHFIVAFSALLMCLVLITQLLDSFKKTRHG